MFVIDFKIIILMNVKCHLSNQAGYLLKNKLVGGREKFSHLAHICIYIFFLQMSKQLI